MARTLALPRIVLVMHALRPYTISQVFELPPGLPFPQPLDLSRGVVSFFASPMRPRRPAAAQPAPSLAPSGRSCGSSGPALCVFALLPGARAPSSSSRRGRGLLRRSDGSGARSRGARGLPEPMRPACVPLLVDARCQYNICHVYREPACVVA